MKPSPTSLTHATPDRRRVTRRRSTYARTLWAVFCVAVLGVGLFSMPSAAEEDFVPALAVRSVDARTGLDVTAVYSGGAPTKDLKVTIDGKDVKPTSVLPLDESGTQTSVMVVLDNSVGVGNGPVQIAKEQLGQLEPGTSGISALGFISTGGSANVLIQPNSSLRSVNSAVATVAPTSGGAALWDGIAKAARSLDDEDERHEIVVVTASPDAGVGTSYPEMLSEVRDSGATVHVIALTGGSPDLAALTELVDTAGGTLQSGTSNDLERQFGVIAGQIDDQYKITLPADSVKPGEDLSRLTLEWGDATAEAGFRPGELNVSAEALRPLESPGFIDRMFSSSLTKWLIVLLGTAAAGMIVYSVGMLILRRKDGLDFTLRHYENYALDEVYDDTPGETYAKTAFLKRAVAITGNMAQRQGLLTRVEDLLERADLPLRPAEALFFYAAIAVVASILAALLTGSIFFFLAVVIVGLLAPKYVVQFLAARRSKKFVGQLPDMLQLLSGTLRAGYSISQGFEAVSQEIDEPMGRELKRIMAEARLGRPLEEALEASAERMDSDDFKWAVMAIRIQREVGGNLAELLMTVADTMTQRERLRRDVASLTAEGRISAVVLGLLPPGIGLVMFTMNKEYISRLTQDGIGLTLLVGSGVMMLVGFAWMKKIIKIEI